MTKMRKLATALTALAIAVTGLVATGGEASAYGSGDCPLPNAEHSRSVDTDYLNVDTGSEGVDLGDQHFAGAPRGNAVMCWIRTDTDPAGGPFRVVSEQVSFRGRLYYDDARYSGCAWMAVSFGPNLSDWGSKRWFKLQSNAGYEDMEIVVRSFDSIDDFARVQLYWSLGNPCRSGDDKVRVHTFTKKRGD